MNIHTKAATDQPKGMSPDEWQARVDLGALYRLVAHHGWDDVIFNLRDGLRRDPPVLAARRRLVAPLGRGHLPGGRAAERSDGIQVRASLWVERHGSSRGAARVRGGAPAPGEKGFLIGSTPGL